MLPGISLVPRHYFLTSEWSKAWEIWSCDMTRYDVQVDSVYHSAHAPIMLLRTAKKAASACLAKCAFTAFLHV